MRSAECGIQPRGAASLEEIEGAHDVGVDEVAGASDGTVHVRLGCQVHHMSDLVALHDFEDGGLVAEIDFFEMVFGMAADLFKVDQMSGIGEAIQIDQPLDFRPVDDVMDDIGADEARTAGDEKVHICISVFSDAGCHLVFFSIWPWSEVVPVRWPAPRRSNADRVWFGGLRQRQNCAEAGL